MTVASFIESAPEPQYQSMMTLHKLFMDYPNISAKLRYGIPFYYQHSWVCYLNPLKAGGIELVFIKGQRLSNESGLLQDRNRKMVSGIHLQEEKDLPMKAIVEIFQEALWIDEKDLRVRKNNLL